MAIEKIENTETASKPPPKKGSPDVKTKSKGIHLRLKEDEEEYSREEHRGLILNQPTKITLMTDFLNCISRNLFVLCHEKPDTNVIDELRGHVE